MAKESKLPPVVSLNYHKGDLIIKEGDYGISIYKILRGKIQIFKKMGEETVILAILERGEVFGEMTFFNFLLEPRSASAMALEDVQLEVLHPARLSEEYQQMPHMIRYITKQTINRLLRMNRLINELSSKNLQDNKKKLIRQKRNEKRKFYRKIWNQDCMYKPAGEISDELDSQGVIKDISASGIGLEVNSLNAHKFDHQPGEKFAVSFQFSSESVIKIIACVKSVKKSKSPGTLFLGLEYVNLSRDAGKQINFFLMP